MDVSREGLTPWVVPRWATKSFYHQVAAAFDFGYRIVTFFEHDPTHYLIITDGYNPDVHATLGNYLEELWQ